MIARLHVILPFSLTIPKQEQFPVYEYSAGDYKVITYPPKISEELKRSTDDAAQVSINDAPAVQADVLHVEFHKDSFERAVDGKCDPPEGLIQKVINSFLVKLRFVTRASQIRPLDFPLASWNLRYLNDDETELEEREGLVRGRFGRKFSFSWIELNKDLWEAIHSLPPDYIPPQWDSLLLDADAALPQVGPSVVLSATALEVFISHILDQIAQKSSIPPELWNWLNTREWLREPTAEEQFDDLLRILSGKSLKEDGALWKAFKNLKAARNSFVHEGTARIASNQVSENDAAAFIKQAHQIIKFVKDNLPKELHWPEFRFNIKIQTTQRILGE